MSRPPLSPVQRAAVDQPVADACVTAGAGSGKTRVLAERYVHLVREHRLDARRLAALTFTEKAANEMRTRIAEYFESAGEEQARADVEFAPISTIHSFCARMLRLHAVEAGVDPTFQVLDEAEARLLREDAALRAENKLRRDDPDAFLAYGWLKTRESRDVLLGRMEHLRGAGVPMDRVAWRSAPHDVSDLLARLGPATDALAAELPHVAAGRQQEVASMIAACRRLPDLIERNGPEFAVFDASRVYGRVKKGKASRRAAFRAAREALLETTCALADACLDRAGEEILLPRLRRILTAFDESYRRLKSEHAALDFTDLELETLALLDRMEAKGRTLDRMPIALLVDEYQDTNPLQDRILAHLRAHAPQFSVGDPKQSIYRFRRADVGVILAERARVEAVCRHELDISYRAHPVLVSAINGLHRSLFHEGRAGVDHEPLTAGGTFVDTAEPLLRVAWIEAADAAKTAEGRAAEAAWIAREIGRLVGSETRRLKAGADRPLRYGDMALLFRARTDMGTYESALSAAQIPFLTLKGQGYLTKEEIGDLLYVLRVLHNPADAHALACVATGPAVGATDRDLLRWFADDPAQAWDRMLADAREDGPYAPPLRALARLRAEALTGSIARVVEGALYDLGLLEVALLQPEGDRKAANLRKAIDVARGIEARGHRDLGDLLRHLSSLREREVGEAEAAVGGEDANVVRLTTVHGSKGLEYPVVFLPDFGRRSPNNTPVIHQDDEGRIAARIADPLEGEACSPGGYREIAAHEQTKQQEESRRLLYVATTRAEERLILSTSLERKTDGKPILPGWSEPLWECLAPSPEPGARVVEIGEGRAEVLLEHVPVPAAPAASALPAAAPAPEAADHAWAAARLEAAGRPTRPLGDTRFVVSVSELLTFAASPARYYEECVLLGGRAQALEQGGSGAVPAQHDEDDMTFAGDGDDDRTRARMERLEAWDEPAEEGRDLDRAALGRVVHAAIERIEEGSELESIVAAALADEWPVAPPAGAADAARAMVARFLASPDGLRTLDALRRGASVRREVDFHTRVRFPGNATVAGFDSLLVKGSIDLWLPEADADGVSIIDHKTNRPSARFESPGDLASYYQWQLRLYALAAERILGRDVSGAALLLLDPGWGPEAVSVPIDVSGPALEETRRLCHAFARAELEGRYPGDWRQLR